MTWWHGRYHAVRSPKYAVKVVGYSARSAFRGGRRLWLVLTADDHTRPVKALRAQTKAKPEDVLLAAQYAVAHRGPPWRWGTALALASAAVVALNYASLGLQLAAGCMMCGGLTAIGWSDKAQILDHGTPPPRIAMDSQRLNNALRATGLLKQSKGDDDGPKVNCVDEIQVIMSRVRAAHGGNAGRVSMWVSDDDPYLSPPTTSPLEATDAFSIWEPVPFGQHARGNRVTLPIVWQSLLFGGLPRRGKTFSQRLLSAAGLLDAYVRHYVYDFKGGQDWIQMRQVAYRLVLGAEDDAIFAFRALVKELLAEMERRFSTLRSLPTSICPRASSPPRSSSATTCRSSCSPSTSCRKRSWPSTARNARRSSTTWRASPAAARPPGPSPLRLAAPQRESVPTKLHEIITIRYSRSPTRPARTWSSAKARPPKVRMHPSCPRSTRASASSSPARPASSP
ncbi:hypothetical protein ACFYPT_37800 [Streptomyces sp. NPDC005529]|uniref:hypothetical protein n=1 Tax=unclassified Streptomyces TaxID=2593676 RepID=UPI0033AFB93B